MSNLLAAGDLARRLFRELERDTADAPGVTRDAYGRGEAVAHAMVRREALALGAQVRADAAGNLYATLAGADRTLPAVVIGSHLDSVPHGGNFDGAAGVLAGLAVMAELRARGVAPPRDLVVMVTRAEESAWFALSYPGARAALGRLGPEELSTPRGDTGRSLADHMREAGFDPDAVARGEPQIDQGRIAAFVEVHIEQGPALVAMGRPLGLVSAISGGRRYPRARILGRYGHSGAEPRPTRCDVVPGFGDLIGATERIWDRHEAAGHRLTITFGRVESDPAQHGGSVVLGELGFSLDMRSDDPAVLEAVDGAVRESFIEIARTRRLVVEPGAPMAWPAIAMDRGLMDRLARAGAGLGLDLPRLVSGGGHDAAAFAEAGVPTAMLFLRNENGSHNPDETMDPEDFDVAVATLVDFVLGFAAA
ncbi:Zn-dependent hydrolase [Aureimonas flava]|uniref:Zn-dependent hydrolase n=1 Tax=Aureimonas flava TaxID=2320271 RepID=A0A3A1WP69_9HYPH|nr:Zn-dependent hydrolase [Aureimonas flava]RIY02572.1 Zn-dependent hydrolase [Aureimonas flava]